jgi:GNAT superfamily N-acetyltransferase
MPAAPELIRATLDHLDQLAPLFDGYRQFYKQPADPEAGRQFLAERLDNDESVIFLALVDGQPAGFTQLYPSFSSVSLRRLWILNDLFVAPAARGHGVGAALLTRARAWAEETWAKGLVLETAIDNPAQHLYEAMGWRRDEDALHYALYL